MSDDYSDLYEEPVERLGTSAYCDLAAEVLQEFFPDATLGRITDISGERFAHIVLLQGETVIDITGVCTVAEMMARHTDVECARLEQVKLEDVLLHFRTHGRTLEERQIVRKRFREQVQAYPGIYHLEAN